MISIYQQHIQKLQQTFESALQENNFESVLIYSGHSGYGFRDDNAYPFKTNPHFKYWLPLTKQSESFVLVEVGKKPHLFLNQKLDYWHAQPQLPDGEWQQHFDLTIITNIADVKNAVKDKTKSLAYIGLPITEDLSLGAINPALLINQIEYNRAYKTEYEIECLRVANFMAAKAHVVAKDAFYAGKTELEIHQAYLESLNIRESGLPYNNIIAFNHNASVLHYDDYQTEQPQQRLSFLIDAGAEFNGYNADISRTYLNGTSEFQQMFDAYQVEYFDLLSEIEVNKAYFDFHDSAHRRISKLLSEFDIVKCDAQQTYEKGYSQLFFPCGVGHYIGTQVHDVGGHFANKQGELLTKDPRYPHLRLLRRMEKNTVFTVEPGIYFIDQLLDTVKDNTDFNWNRVEQFKPYGGFRLEDSIAMNQGNVENLSIDAFNKL
jgi:Xaa-Pro dipeptidase